MLLARRLDGDGRSTKVDRERQGRRAEGLGRTKVQRQVLDYYHALRRERYHAPVAPRARVPAHPAVDPAAK
ncbi:hypothetical protein, partial [Benzoatithermus flavus]